MNPGMIIKQDNGGTYCTMTIEPFDHKSYVKRILYKGIERKYGERRSQPTEES